MFTRYIYIIRHGETVSNKNHLRQGEEGGLTQDGKYQAFTLGMNISKYKINKILCSPYQRAIETLDEIQKNLNVPNEKVIYTPLLAERRNPTSIVGKKYEDPETIKAIDFMDKTIHEENARYEDEENYLDLKIRAEKAIDFIETKSSSKTLVITHGIFLKMIICTIYYNKDFDIKKYIEFSFFNAYSNTALTILKYSPWKIFSKNKWEIMVYNDTSLLADTPANKI